MKIYSNLNCPKFFEQSQSKQMERIEQHSIIVFKHLFFSQIPYGEKEKESFIIP